MYSNLVSREVQHYFFVLLKKLDIKYSSINILPISKNSKNLVSIIAQVIVRDADNENKEYNFIIKSAPRDKEFREFIQSSILFDRELYVYTNVLREFEIFQKEKNVKNPFLSYPKFYGSTLEKMNEALVIQDMTSAGYKGIDYRQHVDYHHVMMVMKEYGKFHALSYALRDQKPETFRKLSKDMEEAYVFGEGWKNIESSMTNSLRKAFDTIDALEHKTLHQECTKCLLHIDKSIQRVLKSETAGDYAVFGHSDCWINNVLFKYDDTQNPQFPTEMCLIDWQLSRLGSPALDLTYFLFSSTDGNTRAHFEDFVNQYHNSVCSFYTELTGNTRICLPYNVLKEHLRKFSIQGLYISIEAYYLSLNRPKEISNETTNVFTFESDNMTEFNRRAKELILDFYNLGYDMY